MNIIDKIVEGLYIGNAYTSKNLELLQRHGITHIVCVGNGLEAWHPDSFAYLQIQILDVCEE
jgi:hypothetical protein